ncbi:DNA-binding response regulator [Clostridium sp. chh4-2]|uniref:response regulator transcription factor n=1 Tax=Clostridium sp. chh4-2 TaxID=2067550 RepID=UPI000CCF8F84|nr:response regulator transcription factor [Clostridium sp. chh4-2]PNV60147.1 DNA-binding response regulator [Clostridium sp. chh4-2]
MNENETGKINIMVVDDMPEIVNYFKENLNAQPDLNVIGTANSGMEAVSVAGSCRPDVILMDIQMETHNSGILAAEKIHKLLPAAKIIIVTIHEDDELLFYAYSVGVMDYIIKTDSIDRILSSVRNVYSNDLLLRPEIADKIRAEFNSLRLQNQSLLFALHILSELTNSEFDVLKAVYEGYSYKQIAQMRYVSQATIKSQVNSILKKFSKKRMSDVTAMLHLVSFDNIIKNL